MVSLGISFLLAELILRFLNLGYNHSPLNPSQTSHHEHPKNFLFTAYSPHGEWDNFNIRINELGNRDIGRTCTHRGNPSKSIIVLGDSFVEAFQVADKDTIAGVIEQATCSDGYSIQNLGVSSYSPLLSYIHFREYIKSKNVTSLNGSFVVQYLYSNDIGGDMDYHKLLKINSTGEEVVPSTYRLTPLQVASRSSYVFRLIRRAQLTSQELAKSNKKNDKKADLADQSYADSIAKCDLSDSDLMLTKKYIRKTRDMVERLGGAYILSAIPTDPRKGKDTQYPCYKDLAKQLNIRFVSYPSKLIANPADFYYEKDIHLNPSGNRLLGSHMLKVIIE